MGTYYTREGNFAKAEPLLQRAVRIMKSFPNSPNAATPLSNLAYLYNSRKKYRLAAQMFEQAIALVEKFHGSDDPDLITMLNNLGTVYFTDGRTDRAEAAFRRALEIADKSAGHDDIRAARPLLGLARVLAAEKRKSEGQALLDRARQVIQLARSSDNELITGLTVTTSEVFRSRDRK